MTNNCILVEKAPKQLTKDKCRSGGSKLHCKVFTLEFQLVRGLMKDRMLIELHMLPTIKIKL